MLVEGPRDAARRRNLEKIHLAFRYPSREGDPVSLARIRGFRSCAKGQLSPGIDAEGKVNRPEVGAEFQGRRWIPSVRSVHNSTLRRGKRRLSRPDLCQFRLLGDDLRVARGGACRCRCPGWCLTTGRCCCGYCGSCGFRCWSSLHSGRRLGCQDRIQVGLCDGQRSLRLHHCFRHFCLRDSCDGFFRRYLFLHPCSRGLCHCCLLLGHCRIGLGCCHLVVHPCSLSLCRCCLLPCHVCLFPCLPGGGLGRDREHDCRNRHNADGDRDCG